MKTFQRRGASLALAALALAFGGTTAVAADYIKLADGTKLKGDATGYDDVQKVLSFRTEDGRDMILRLDELDQRSVYQVTRSKVPKDNGKGQLQLANFARDIGLYVHSGRHYRAALAADPSLKPEIDREVVVAKRMAADWCMANARDAIAKNDTNEAEKWLKLLVDKLPEQPQAQEASEMLEEYYAKNAAAKDDHLEEKSTDLLEGELKKGKQAYDKMLAETQKALTEKNPGSKSVNAFEKGIKEGERALREIAKVEKGTKDPGVLETTAGYTRIVNSHIIDIHMHLANHWSTRSSYDRAMTEVNKALAIDPKSSEALGMRNRIQEASSRGGRGWW